MAKDIIIKAVALYDGEKRLENMTVVVNGNTITDLSASSKAKADYEGYVTPGFIDPHSHIGMFREGEPQSEAEGNDFSNQIMPLSDPLNSVYFDDRAFRDTVDFGVLYSCIVPGSGNLVGGKAKVIRNFVDNRKDALVLDYGYKMALGYNPRSTTSWKGERPTTRMGVYQMLEKRFDDVLQKKAKSDLGLEKKKRELEKTSQEKKMSARDKEKELALIEAEAALEMSSEEAAILDLLSGKKTVKVHVHKEDDALYLLELVKKYKFRITADHLSDVHSVGIFNEFAKADIPLVYGPLGSQAYKVELKNEEWSHAGILMKSRARYGLMTDHPVILSYQLRDSLKYFLVQGMSEAEAIGIITKKNAEILGIGESLGSIESGKLASLLVWNREPLHLGAIPKMVMAEGKVIRKR